MGPGATASRLAPLRRRDRWAVGRMKSAILPALVTAKPSSLAALGRASSAMPQGDHPRDPATLISAKAVGG
ncbi:MAG: hypothetical protein ACYDB7_02320 [Mycobacteriales bacterium]